MAVLLLILGATADAAVISAAYTFTNSQPFPPSVAPPPVTATSGYVVAEFVPPEVVYASANAYADDAGRLAVGASVAPLFGQPAYQEVTAAAYWEDIIINSSETVHRYVLDFYFSGGAVGVAEDIGLRNTMISALSLEVMIDGAPIFSTSAALTGVGASVEVNPAGPWDIFSFTSPLLGGTLDAYHGRHGYTIDPFEGSVDLGVYSPGESFTVRYQASAVTRYQRSLDVNPASTYTIGMAFMDDPVAVGGLGAAVRVANVSPVPEPGSLAIFAFGFAMLSIGILRKR